MTNSIIERATLLEAQMQKQMTVAKVAKTIKNKTPNPDKKPLMGNIKEAPSIIKRAALQQYANTRPNKGNVKEIGIGNVGGAIKTVGKKLAGSGMSMAEEAKRAVAARAQKSQVPGGIASIKLRSERNSFGGR